jgi:FHS family L-fucose permease-like MFS transporter
VALTLIVSLFFLWGVANNLNDILIKQFKKVFELSDFQAGLVQSAFYLGYFLFALPAGLFMRRFGYKAALLMGLFLYGTGAFLFYPAGALHTYGFFLVALFVIASGLAFLETSANPLVTVLGPPEGAARRLNLAQSFNPMGSIAGVLIGQQFILSGIEHTPAGLAALDPAVRRAYLLSESAAVKTPYLFIGVFVLIWALFIALTRFPPAAIAAHAEREHGRRSLLSLGRLLGRFRFMSAVVAQFFYVGAQVGIWSFLIRYTQDVEPGTPEKRAANYLTASLVLFMVGRFSGTALMRQFAPVTLLTCFAAVNVGLTVAAVLLPGPVGVWCLVASSFFMSIMFPTIFALGLVEVGEDDRQFGSSLIVMAIIGGALLPALMGAMSDMAGMSTAMIAPAICFLTILVFALLNRRRLEKGITAPANRSGTSPGLVYRR